MENPVSYLLFLDYGEEGRDGVGGWVASNFCRVNPIDDDHWGQPDKYSKLIPPELQDNHKQLNTFLEKLVPNY
jgi:hypothetical protein